jgi:hypothetical protein
MENIITDTRPLIFLMGTTGQTGRLILEDFDRTPDARMRIGGGKQKDLERLRAEGAMPSSLISTIRGPSARRCAASIG